jgi:hypothetical protein
VRELREIRRLTEVLEPLSDKQKVTAVFEEMPRGIHEESGKDVKAFGEDRQERLAKVRAVAESILCKVKRAVSLQTFQARKNDVETQYNKTDITRRRKSK